MSQFRIDWGKVTHKDLFGPSGEALVTQAKQAHQQAIVSAERTKTGSTKRSECLVAHRAWWAVLLGNDVAFLRSWTREALWPFGKPFTANGAVCMPDRASGGSMNQLLYAQAMMLNPAAGGNGDGAGVYAFKHLDASGIWNADAKPIDAGGARVVRVYGTVALWGKVVEHLHGYRAQYAYPQRIICPDAETAGALGRWYGCETEVAS